MEATVTVAINGEGEDMAVANLPEGVFLDELGRTMAPLDMLVSFEANPRDPDDFDLDRSAAFRSLYNSIAQVGVREPIPVYREETPDGTIRLRQKAGHRRKEAVRQINESREAAYKARLEKGELSPTDLRPKELELIEFVPVAIGDKPATPFDEKADMFLSESQRLKWKIELTLPFFKDTYDAALGPFRDDLDWLAARLGIPVARVKLLTTIVDSPSLYVAAISKTEKPLPKRGREKTLRSVNRCAEVLFKHRKQVCINLTGRALQDTQMLEQLRELMVQKAGLVAERRWPAGVHMERLAPRLRDPDEYSDEELIDWGTGKLAVLEFPGAPTTIGGNIGGGGTNGQQGDETWSLVALGERYRRINLSELSGEELGVLSDEVIEAGKLIDELVAAVRGEKRARQVAG